MNVIIYQENAFQGKSQNLPIGRYNMAELTIGDNQLGSLKIPKGLKVTLYQGANFQGINRTFIKDVSLIGSFNNVTSSIVVEYRMLFFPNVKNYYKISTKYGGKVATVGRSYRKKIGNLLQWNWRGSNRQLWRFIPLGNGYYRIVNKRTKGSLSVIYSSKNNGANIYPQAWQGDNNQQWKLDLLEDGCFKISARHSDKYFNVARKNKNNGAYIRQREWHGGWNQRFKIEKVEVGKPVLRFDGKNGMVTATVNVSKAGYTTSIWFKTKNNHCGIFCVDSSNHSISRRDRHIYLKDGNLCARLGKNETIATTGQNYADGKWHCVAHVFGGGVDGQRLYVDGVLKAQGTLKASAFNSQDRINLGFSTDGEQRHFQGEIAQISIWSVARSQRDIRNWQERIRGNESGLQLFWNIGISEGRIIQDRSKNKLNGTIVGNVVRTRSSDFLGTFIPTITPEEINAIREEAETLSEAGRILVIDLEDNPPEELPQESISDLVSAGKMPQYNLMERLVGAVENNELIFTEELLGAFSSINNVAGDLLSPLVKIENPKISFAKSVPGMPGVPGMELLENPTAEGNLASPENHALKVSGDVTFLLGIETKLKYGEFFYYKGKRHCSLKFLLPDPINFSEILFDIPIFDHLEIKSPVIVLCTTSTLYDPILDSGVNSKGFNFFGNFEVAESQNEVIRFIGNLLFIEELAFHVGVDFLGVTPEYIFEMAMRRDITIINSNNFKLKFTRSDFAITLAGKPLEPAFSFSNDLVITLKANNEENHLVFTGAMKIEPESITASYTMNGTGRSPEGKLSGNVQNTSEWKNPFGIPGIIIYQMAAQIGFTYAPPWLDNVGFHGNMKIGDIDGSISFLVDINDPDQFVLAGTTKEITLIQILTSIAPVTFLIYQTLSEEIRNTMNETMNVSLQDVKISIVPSACSIGGIHFRDEGITLKGQLNLWGWNASASINVDTFDGLTVRGDMDQINIENIFIVSGAQGDPGPILSLQVSKHSTPYLYVSSKVQLLGLSQELKIEVNVDRFEFLFKNSISNLLEVSLVCSYSDYDLVAAGNINFNLNVTIPTIWGNIPLVNIGFNAATELKIGKIAGFYMKISGDFHYNFLSFTFPTLELDIAPRNFKGIHIAVVDALLNVGEELFKEMFITFKDWAEAVKQGVIQFTGEIADIGKNIYDATSQRVVTIYKFLDKMAPDIARGLKIFYDITERVVVKILKNAGYVVEEIGEALIFAYDATVLVVADALKFGGYIVSVTGNFIKNIYKLDAAALNTVLREVGYAANEIKNFFNDLGDGFVDFFTEDIPDFVTEDIPDFVTEDIPDFVTEDIPDFVTEDIPDFVTEDIPDFVTEDIPDFVTEDIPDFVTEDVPNFVTEDVPNFFTNTINPTKW